MNESTRATRRHTLAPRTVELETAARIAGHFVTGDTRSVSFVARLLACGASRAGLDPARVAGLKPVEAGLCDPFDHRHCTAEVWDGVEPSRLPWWLGAVYEQLLARTATERRRRGSYYTPPALAARVVAAARGVHPTATVRTVLDPACGAGCFLLAAHADGAPARALHGVDLDPCAVWVARVALVIATGTPATEDAAWCARVRVGDALAHEGLGTVHADFIVGNPPWNAFSGRAAHPLDPVRRSDYRARFASFAKYPTTHGMFVEQCANHLAPDGTLALLLPTQLTDLDGYAATRFALTSRARVCAPLDDLGFDAFAGVTEPTTVVVARADPAPVPSRAAWPLRSTVSRIEPPWLAQVRTLAPFPPGTFRELGFRTASTLARTHLATVPDRTARHTVPLREGADLEPFHLQIPTLFLDPDPSALAGARTVLHTRFASAPVLLRQTARVPVAALHTAPCAFRNSLLAAFSDTPEALVALLNSALFRLLHSLAFRDGTQAVYPQVKIAHLRTLPAPPAHRDPSLLAPLAHAAARAQSTRFAAIEALGAPRRLFAPVENAIPIRTDRARSLGLDAHAYTRTHDVVETAWNEFLAVRDAIDRAVEKLYDLPDGATRNDPRADAR